jgi:hypothetical protein
MITFPSNQLLNTHWRCKMPNSIKFRSLRQLRKLMSHTIAFSFPVDYSPPGKASSCFQSLIDHKF